MFKRIAAFAGIVLATGCTDLQQPTAPPALDGIRRLDASAAADTLLEEDPARAGEILSTRIAKNVARFGGFSTDSTGALVVYLTDPGNRADVEVVKDALAEYQREHGRVWAERGMRSEITIRKGRYSFAQLRRFRGRANDDVLATEGVLFTDIDELANRYVIGIDRAREASTRAAVQTLLARRGIPRESVEFEARMLPTQPVDECPVEALDCNSDPCTINPAGPTCNPDPCTVNPADPSCNPDPCIANPASCTPEFGLAPAAAPITDIRKQVYPLVGGVQIEGVETDRGTLGFTAFYCVQGEVNATYAYSCRNWYVVTSHQTRALATVDRTRFRQPDVFSSYTFAEEAIDTHWHTTPFTINVDGAADRGSQCQKHESYRSLVCRRSDMALLRPTSDNDYRFGYLVRPRNRYSDSFDHYDAQYAVDPNNPTFRIVGEIDPGVGYEVDKIGATTGLRTGRVTRKCVDILRRPADPQYSNVNEFVLRCQTEVQIHGLPGDSGGPVFWNLKDGTVQLAGLYHGGSSFGAGLQGYRYFSPMAMIRNDLGLAYHDQANFKVFAF